MSGVNVGNIRGDNIYRNVLSITGGSEIETESVVGVNVGLFLFDIETNAAQGKTENIRIKYAKGRQAGVIGTTSSDYCDNIVIDSLDLNPAFSPRSTPSIPAGSNDNDLFVVRNTKNIKIGFARLHGFDRLAVTVITGAGEIGLETLDIGYLDIDNSSQTDATYTWSVGGDNTNITVGNILANSEQSGRWLFGPGVNSLVVSSGTISMASGAAFARDVQKVELSNVSCISGYGILVQNAGDTKLKGVDFNGERFTNYSTGVDVDYCTVTASFAPFVGNNALYVKNSTINGVYYGDGEYIKETTTAELTSAASTVNTTRKYLGKVMINQTTGALVYATGSSPTDVWKTVDGATTYTPA